MKKIFTPFVCALLFMLMTHVNQCLSQSLNNNWSFTDSVGNKIDYENTKVIKSVYVKDRRGVDAMECMDKESKKLFHYDYGNQLDVIEDAKDWFGIRERITRKFERNGSKIESTSWEKVYVSKDKVGAINEVELISSDLNVISGLIFSDTAKYGQSEEIFHDMVKLELIEQSLFNQNRESAINYLLSDTFNNSKNNGVIELECKEKIVRFVDKPDAEEEREEYQYLGQITFLNQFLIAGSYWESVDYKFIDKITGEETAVFIDYPNISPDKKYIICINTNPYNMTADFELYSINESRVTHTVSVSFKYWMPVFNADEMYWSKDGYLYIAVNHINTFWKEDGNLNDKFQYIRIKLND